MALLRDRKGMNSPAQLTEPRRTNARTKLPFPSKQKSQNENAFRKSGYNSPAFRLNISSAGISGKSKTVILCFLDKWSKTFSQPN